MITGSWPRRNEWTEKNTNAADRRIFKTQKALFMIEKINPPISRLTRIDEDHFISPRRHPSTSLRVGSGTEKNLKILSSRTRPPKEDGRGTLRLPHYVGSKRVHDCSKRDP